MKKKQTINISILTFLMCIYGTVLLMVGYTNLGLGNLLGLHSDQYALLAIPQTVGFTLSAVLMKFIVPKYNMRTLLAWCFGASLICLILLSQLDRITDTNHANITSLQHTKARIAYIIINFTVGFAIVSTSPISGMYISTEYHSTKRSQLLSVTQGIYCLGAAILPLCFASLIQKNENVNPSDAFDSLRFFYYIASGLVFIALVSCFFLDHRFDKSLFIPEHKKAHRQHVLDTKTSEHEEEYHHSRHPRWDLTDMKILAIVFTATGLLMLMYITCESVFNYSWPPFTLRNTGSNPSASIQVKIITSFGIVLLFQGLTRMVCGLYLVKKIKYKYFVMGSCIFLAIAFGLLAGNITKNNINLIFLIAPLLGLGLGNILVLIFAYCSELNNKMSGYIAGLMSIIIRVGVLVTLLWVPFLLETKHGLLIVSCICTGLSVIMGSGLFITTYFLKKWNYVHRNEIKFEAKYLT